VSIGKLSVIQKILAGLLASAIQASFPASAEAAIFSLANDFSYSENSAKSVWSYRMDDMAESHPAFPLLKLHDRDANSLWGSTFADPPIMWSDAEGYWGIGKNTTGREQSSPGNDVRWAPGEVLLHPRNGGSPSRLAIGWKAPSRMKVDVHYNVGVFSTSANGVGVKIMKRSGDNDTPIVVTKIDGGIADALTGIVVDPDDQLFFRFDTRDDAGGDITRVSIVIDGALLDQGPQIGTQLAGGAVTAGSDFTFSAPAAGAGPFQWRKDGSPIAGATTALYTVKSVKSSDAGAYSVVMGSVPSGNALLKVTAQTPRPQIDPLTLSKRFESPTPHQIFTGDYAQEERELKTNVLMMRFAESRKRLADEPYRPGYHFVSPENMMNDPNGLCFWQGRWHLFYQGYPPDEFPNPKDILKRRQHWGHAVSEDLVHWRDLPYAIYPGVERMCFSGGTVAEKDQVVAFYPGIAAGQMVAIAKDPLLLNWEKLGGKPVNSPSGDSCIWKEGDTYYGLVSANRLVSSKNLRDWMDHGEFLDANPLLAGDALACPNFVPIGDKHLLLSFSHTLGGQYMLGDYDTQRHRFKPYNKGLFNHAAVAPGGVHAPSAAVDGRGGVINILNINDGMYSSDWDQLMSLPQRLTLGPDKLLRIQPVDAVASLRAHHQHIEDMAMPANNEIVLPQISGKALELEAEIDPKESRWVQLNVLRSANAEEVTSITFYNYDRKLAYWYHTKGVVCLDGSHSSARPDVWMRPPERADLERGEEMLRLRVFVDHSVVEVFVNEKVYLAMRVYPGRHDSTGVSIRAGGQDARVKKLDAWEMKSIYPNTD
jgi:beta-fructofuranosidase